ncbi:MAG: NAD-dependent protein deacetylase [Propionibacteriaceae bacterium]
MLDQVAELITGRRLVVLTGAGISTDSGIPDYRGPDSPKASPMLYDEFVGSESARRRYWARSYLGWQRIGTAHPNPGHRVIAQWEQDGRLSGLITQNVDGLHTAAGSQQVVDLHGRIAEVICLRCGRGIPRAVVQERLAGLNPGLRADEDLGHAELRPDGDAVVDDWQDFVLTECAVCGGVLKPDVVFFGESVPKARALRCIAWVDQAEVLLVAGSSLTVMSGLRFVRQAAKVGKPVVIINRGETRGDGLATVKIDNGCSEVLTALHQLRTGALG